MSRKTLLWSGFALLLLAMGIIQFIPSASDSAARSPAQVPPVEQP